MTGRLDGVMVQTLDGRHELRHRHCIGVDTVDGDSPHPMQPNRDHYKTDARYQAAVTRSLQCRACSEEVSPLA